MKLTRAAFAVMLKFSDQTQVLLNLMTQIDSEGDAKTMAKEFKENKNADFETLFKRWEQASQMRRWTQQVKLQLREAIEAEEIKILREEINTANPDNPPFTEPLNED